MLSPFAPVIMPLLMTENGLKKTHNDSDPEDGNEDVKLKSFRNTVLKEAAATEVNGILKKRPLSETCSEDERLSLECPNKRQKTSSTAGQIADPTQNSPQL